MTKLTCMIGRVNREGVVRIRRIGWIVHVVKAKIVGKMDSNVQLRGKGWIGWRGKGVGEVWTS